jgi:hypothetical protein
MEAYRSELSIFDPPEIQSSTEKGHCDTISPAIGSALNVGYIEFEILGGDNYIDLNDTMLFVDASVVNADGSALSTETGKAVDAAFANAPLHTMFSDVLVYFNDTKVSGGDQLYAYKAIATLLLSYSKRTLQQQISSTGFIMDQASKMDEAANTGHVARKAWNAGKLYMGRLQIDVFQQHRYLISGVSVRIRLQKASSEFAIMCHSASAKPKFQINSACLEVRRVTIAPGVILAHERALNQSNAMYPYSQKVINTFNMTKGLQSYVKENLYYGALPKLLIVAFVASDAYVGTYNKNPFNFQHFNTCLVSLKKNGENIPSSDAFIPEFDRKMYLREYMALFTAFNMMGRDDSITFDYDEYAGGYCFFVFNLTPDQSMTTSTAQQLSDNTNVRLDVKFSKALPEDVTLLTMGLFDGIVEIDAERRVYVSEI